MSQNTFNTLKLYKPKKKFKEARLDKKKLNFHF